MIKVMLVEDDPMVAELNRSYVGSIEGFSVIASVRSGQEALTLLDTLSVDLILLDVYMPGMQGLTLLTEIRALGLGTDVILVTAASDTVTIREALRLGAVDYLIKPFEFERLKKALLVYKEKNMTLKQKGSVSQTELDQLLGDKPFVSESIQLPKGLDRTTLKKIHHCLNTYPKNVFSAEDIAKVVGITRVSVRKYLEFLTEVKALVMHVTYGSIGRPVHRFERLPGYNVIVERYLGNH